MIICSQTLFADGVNVSNHWLLVQALAYASVPNYCMVCYIRYDILIRIILQRVHGRRFVKDVYDLENIMLQNPIFFLIFPHFCAHFGPPGGRVAHSGSEGHATPLLKLAN